MTKKRDLYHQFGMYLARQKVKKSHAIARLLLDKFAYSHGTNKEKRINVDELKEREIVGDEKGQYKLYVLWREEMVKKGLIWCQAKKDEKEEKEANHKAGLYCMGQKIEKYIQLAIVERLPDRVSILEEKMDSKAENSRVEALEAKVEELSEKVDGIITFVLKANPPDTPKRRKIVGENFDDYDKCLELLKEVN